MQPAGIYARVSSERQREEHTIDSQIAALIEYAENEGYHSSKGLDFSRMKVTVVRPWYALVWND